MAEGTKPLGLMALGALGVVYGDIGTSPLYALRECFAGTHPVELTKANVLGVLSLIFWALIVVISIKYLVLILRADNRGEGGIIALMALVHPEHSKRARVTKGLVGLGLLGLFGAALLYGDGVITPAISVLGAVEGIAVAAPGFRPLILPIAVVILGGLFLVQRFGTGRVGAAFGPIMLVWFVTLGVLGLRSILAHPDVLDALNPAHAVRFFAENGVTGFLVLGSVFLVVTGGEALYADMGHFGRRPIRAAWFTVALPGLVLNYFGQGALLISDPTAIENPFYHLAPDWAVYGLLALATMAAVIASQAIITGAFSLTMQAVHLGYSPRLRIEHTSASQRGQIYMPEVNWALMIGTIALVLAFRSSSALAGAYGMAVTSDMVITTILVYVLARHVWGWSRPRALGVFGLFLAIDLAFFVANIPKIPHGGWLPLVLAAIAFTLMTTWRRGRKILAKLLAQDKVALDDFLKRLSREEVRRVPGTAVFMTGNPVIAPVAMIRNLEHNKVLHERVVVFSVSSEDAAYVPEEERVRHASLHHGFHRVVVRYGFMEEPDVPAILHRLRADGKLDFDPDDMTYFLGREWLIPTRKPSGMAFWREKVFAVMTRNSQPATTYFRLPPERTIEVGAQVKLELPNP